MRISDDIKAKIQTKITEIESQTTSELVCVITKRSARYVFCPLFMAALMALFLPVLEIVGHLLGYHESTLTFLHQAFVFVGLAALFVLTPLNRFLTPKWLMHQNCRRYSAEQFFVQKLHETKDRNAILFFVSWDEKFVQLIADKGIHEKVPPETWNVIVKDFIVQVKAKQVEAGFLDSMEKAGALLIQHFPISGTNDDELPNHLIVLDGPEYVS